MSNIAQRIVGGVSQVIPVLVVVVVVAVVVVVEVISSGRASTSSGGGEVVDREILESSSPIFNLADQRFSDQSEYTRELLASKLKYIRQWFPRLKKSLFDQCCTKASQENPVIYN